MSRIASQRIVKGSGPLDAQMWGIGEAPGKEEDAVGKPFVGRAGRQLDRALQMAKIPRKAIRLDNCFKSRPPENDVGYFFSDKGRKYVNAEGETWVEHLKRDLELHKPNVVLALGAIPLKILTGKKRIKRWRGSFLESSLVPGQKVYATYHPSAVMRNQEEKGERKKDKKKINLLPLFILDLERAWEDRLFPELARPVREFVIGDRLPIIMEYLMGVPREAKVACDIETIVGANVITRIGFSWEEKKAISIPFYDNGVMVWTTQEFAFILQALDEFFQREDLIFIFHNAPFDTQYLARYFHLFPKHIEDSMILHHASNPHFEKSLDFCTSVYTREPYYKDDGKQWGFRVGGTSLSIYNCRDCAVTREIMRPLVQDARELGTYEGYKRSMSYMPSIIAMGLRGVRFDRERQQELKLEFKRQIFKVDEEIEELTGQAYNISTGYTADLARLLYIDCGFKQQFFKGKPTTNAAALRRIAKQNPDHPIPKLVATKKKLLKLVNTYLDIKTDEDNRVRTSYNLAATTTWRLSSSESAFGGGGNFQNIPKHPDFFTGLDVGKELRKLFIPDEGYVFLASDLAQAEARVVAWLAGEEIEINAYLNGEDTHWINTIDLLELPPGFPRDKNNPEHTQWRHTCKAAKHASNYGEGAYTLQDQLLAIGIDKSKADCQRMLNAGKASRPRIEAWKRQVKSKLNLDRTLISPIGRKRVFYGRWSDSLLRSALAFQPQNTVGELTCMGIRDVYNEGELEKNILNMMLNVHDEMIVQCREDDVPKAAEIIKSNFERTIEINNMPLKIPCDFKMSNKSWGDLKEINPF